MLLFTPIDIDLTGIENFVQYDDSFKIKAFNEWWSTSRVSEQTIEKNNFNKYLDQLPFDRVTVVSYKIQTKTVDAHVDVNSRMGFDPIEIENIKAAEPAGYRLVICGQKDALEIYDGKEWKTIILPHVPCCYVLDSMRCRHRVKEDIGRKLVYVRGIINLTKHQELLQRSIAKYHGYQVYSK